MASVGSGYVRLVLICNFGLWAEGSLHKFMVGVLGVIWRYWGVCSPMGPSSAVGHGRNPVPFARRVCGNAEKYHTLKAQRYRRKPRREPRLGPRREPRRVWLRS